MSAPIRCVVCQNESEIKQLKQQIVELSLKLQQYEHQQMKVTINQKQLIEEQFEQSNRPLLNEEFDITGYQFITLTYDPKKFGYLQTETAQREYFLSALLDKSVYGCFEYHKNGNMHCHFVMKSTEEEAKKMKQDIRYKFTDNPKNRDFMDIGIAKDKVAIRYINKESRFYFKHKYLKRGDV